MKKILSLSLAWLLLFQLNTQAQSITLTLPDSLAGKNWVKNLVREELKKVGTTPTTPTEPIVKLDPCFAGPIIKRITNVSATYLNAQFHGEGVFKIAWWIRDAAGKSVREGEVDPVNNTPGITYNTLPAGNYTLVFQGKSCLSNESLFPFTISGSVGVVVPPQVGDGAQQTIAKGMDEHLKLDIKKAGDVLRITDTATPNIGADYQFWYFINSQLVKGFVLEDFPVAYNNTLRILKLKVKPGLENLNKWHAAGISDDYYDNSVAEGFSYNTSIAYQTFSLPSTQKANGFLNHIPQGYDPSLGQAQWADIAPDMQLPKGHVWVAPWQGWSTDIAYRKGVTHLAHHGLPWNDADGNKEVFALKKAGKTYSNVQRIEVALNLTRTSGPDDFSGPGGINKSWWPTGPLTEEEAVRKADQTDASDALWITEMSENVSFMYPDAEMWIPFYKRLNERYQANFGARGIPYYISHDYFHLWSPDISLTRNNNAAYHKKLLATEAGNLPKTPFSPGGALSHTNLIMEGCYLGAPGMFDDYIYSTIFRFQLNKNMGYMSGVFLAGDHEYRPNNWQEVNYPEGKFFVSTKIPLDPAVHIAAGFIAQTYGNVFVEWGGSSKHSTKKFDKYNFDQNYREYVWKPTDGYTGFNHWAKPGEDSYGGYSGSTDLSYFSQRLYNETFGKVNGGIRQYLKFRIDGGAWITPSQVSCEEVVDAFHERRGFVLSESKDGKIAWFYLNSYTDNNWHSIEVELPTGQIVPERVAGNGIHAKLQ